MNSEDSVRSPAIPGPLGTLLERRGVRQFVKFCIVGAGSTAISFGLYALFIEVVHLDAMLGSLESARPVALAIAFVCAVTNGFIWNNRWTFRRGGEDGASRRYAKFFGTNLVGLILNQVIVNGVAHAIPAPMKAQMSLQSGLKDPAGLIGLAVATVVVVFWNFTASKYWTFKH